ncbi:MAG: AraC family transcriptional regulator [Clostridia bacterium]|nr:AraC family transcriptional regulator [Clostridia bacterium]
MNNAKQLLAKWHTDASTGFLYRYIISSTERLVCHYHDYYEVFLIADGKVYHNVNGEKILLEKGDLLFIRPDDTHVLSYYREESFSIANLAFTSEICDSLFAYLDGGCNVGLLKSSPLPPCVRLPLKETERLIYTLQSINTASYTDSAEKILKMKSVLFDVFSKYFSKYTVSESGFSAWFEYLCEELKKPSVFRESKPDMCAICGKSKEHISRVFKRNLGITPSEYLCEIRLNYAANLLKNTNLSILEVSLEAGFDNLSWFYRRFNERFGVAPRGFRRVKE